MAARRSGLRRLLVAFALLVVLGAGVFYVLRDRTAPTTAAASGGASRAVPVVVATATQRDVDRIDEAVGTVEAASTVQVTTRVDGQILEAGFQEGQMVSKGDLLFRIDPKPYQAALDQAQAALTRDQAQLASARSDLDRYSSLSKEGYAPAQQLEKAQADAKALAASVAADKAAIDIARLHLGYTEIRSPIDGKTGVMLVHPGNLVRASSDTPLVVVTKIHPVKVSFSLPQQDLPLLQGLMAGGGIEITITVPGDDKTPIEARVDFIDNTVDQQTGTIALRATVDNEDGRLVPGQFVNVAVAVAHYADAITVPRDAVNTGQDGTYVYVVGADSKAEARPVTVGYQTDTMAVIAEGLKAGETVVQDGQLRLAPGMAVTIQKADAAPTQAPAS